MRQPQLTAKNLLTVGLALSAVSATLLITGCGGSGGKSPNDPALQLYVQGVIAYNKGDNETAIVHFQEAIAKRGDLVMARSMLGDLYRLRSDYDPAREQYETLTRIDPYDFNNHFRLGLAYQFLERFNEAIGSYLKALHLRPTHAPSSMNLGMVYLTTGNPNEAARYAQQAVDLDPASASAWANLGVALDAVGDFKKAEAAYRKALDIDTNQPHIQLYLAENLLLQKKFTDARSVMLALIKTSDTPLHRKRCGDAYAGEKNYDQAIKQYEAALKLDANYYPALNEIGNTCIAQYEKGLTLDDTKRKAALDVWQKSLSIYRQQPKISALVQKHSKATMFQP